MNPQEKDLLTRFLEQLTSAQSGQKDTEAERLIRDAVARQPDAAYLLVQRALQLDQAFQMTQAQVTKLQSELDQSRTSTGTTSGGFLNDANAWGSRPAAPAVSVSGRPLAAAPQAQPAPGAAPPARPSPWGGSNLLGTMAGAAAGVVAGSFLYQGIQGLMNRNDSGAGQRTADAQDGAHTSGPLEESPSDTFAGTDESGDTYADADGFEDSGGDIA